MPNALRDFERLRENDIDVAPVFGDGGAFAGPVGGMVEVIGNVSGPEASDVAIEQVTLDGLAETRGAAGGINLPSGIKNQRAAHGDVRLGSRATLLKRDDVAFGCGFDDMLLDATRFFVDGAKMIHD